jgi:hypothetical protein
VDSCKELAEISSSRKQITSPLLSKSKAFVVANLTIRKELKLVDQIGEENNGGNSDQNGIGDVAMEHTEDEFEKQEKHDEEHEELDDELQSATKKMKASLAQTKENKEWGTNIMKFFYIIVMLVLVWSNGMECFKFGKNGREVYS